MKPGTTEYKRARNAVLYDRLELTVPKGRKATIEALAKEHGESVNGLINGLLRGAAGLTEEEWRQKDDQ